MYRKGIDLLVEIIPHICDVFQNVHFIIGGDGSKKLSLEEMVEREQLQVSAYHTINIIALLLFYSYHFRAFELIGITIMALTLALGQS